ncbi:MAG: hypothetical protein JO329_28100 [Planctomycetaceae bacterium]|nr:hypothetical protein [Planctomycetaceae bacterium]
MPRSNEKINIKFRPHPPHADGLFRLSALPADLWPMGRMAQEFRTTPQMISRWLRGGKLPGPCLRRGGRAYWDPNDVASHLRNRLRRIGAE